MSRHRKPLKRERETDCAGAGMMLIAERSVARRHWGNLRDQEVFIFRSYSVPDGPACEQVWSCRFSEILRRMNCEVDRSRLSRTEGHSLMSRVPGPFPTLPMKNSRGRDLQKERFHWQANAEPAKEAIFCALE